MSSRMKREVMTPDGRPWIVQLVWWRRPRLFETASGAGTSSAGVGLIVDAIHVVFWPLILAFRVLFHRRWLIEARQSDDYTEGAAWHVQGLGAGVSAVDAIAAGIEAGNQHPAPPGASRTRFRIKPR